MSVELLPLKPNQHTVTFVPKATTDLPFFNLTYNKRNTPSEIKFEGKDEAGNPMRWEVFHNTSDKIGKAGVQAHEVWYLLIKPAIDASRLSDGTISQIIKLGGIRECLRLVGWTAGGHEARELIKVLSQIAFAGCVADLWFPTGETDREGKKKYLQVKGRFSRISVYAIGEHHLTKEELENAKFDFDLEDSLYIELNPLEAKLQQIQADSQKLIDNEYMFSVKPIARRWYELLAGKVYGTVKHNAPFFEIKYSWYIKHHHTLKRFYTMKRVREQMNRAVKDHIALGFLKKVKYRKYKHPDQELDFIIRYYVGRTAKDSINKIKGYILNNERKKRRLAPKVKKANITPKIVEKAKNRPDRPDQNEKNDTVQFSGSDGNVESREDLALLDTVTDEHREVMKTLVTKYQIKAKTAYQLVTEKYEECVRQIEAMDFREIEITNQSGFLIRAIEESYGMPKGYLDFERRKKEGEERERIQKAIADCSICDEYGYRELATENQDYPSKMHECSHDEKIEKKYVEYKR